MVLSISTYTTYAIKTTFTVDSNSLNGFASLEESEDDSPIIEVSDEDSEPMQASESVEERAKKVIDSIHRTTTPREFDAVCSQHPGYQLSHLDIDFGETALHRAAFARNIPLLVHIIGLEGIGLLQCRDKNNETALCQAASMRSPDVVQNLIELKADTYEIRNAFCLAFRKPHNIPTLKVLLAYENDLRGIFAGMGNERTREIARANLGKAREELEAERAQLLPTINHLTLGQFPSKVLDTIAGYFFLGKFSCLSVAPAKSETEI